MSCSLSSASGTVNMCNDCKFIYEKVYESVKKNCIFQAYEHNDLILNALDHAIFIKSDYFTKCLSYFDISEIIMLASDALRGIHIEKSDRYIKICREHKRSKCLDCVSDYLTIPVGRNAVISPILKRRYKS